MRRRGNVSKRRPDSVSGFGCRMIEDYFDIFKDIMKVERYDTVLIPFFHVLFLKFIGQMQHDGAFYQLTDYSQHNIVVEESLIKRKETVYDFVYAGKIVSLKTESSLLDRRYLFMTGNVPSMVRAFNIRSHSEDAVNAIKDFFKEFASGQNFAAIKSEAADIVRKESNFSNQDSLSKFYL